MFIEPNSHIKIYRGIESSSKRRPIFKTATAQTNYFNAHLAFDYTPTTHVKYTMNRVRVGLTVAQLLGCNYLSFVNPNFGNKTYYAMIIGDPVYINNECTELTYAVDYFQTDMFNVTLEPCYNDREQLTDEDYTKSVTDPYDKTIQEFWTEEALPISKDIEDNYEVETDQTAGCFYAANSVLPTDGNKSMTVIAVPHLTPPNPDEQTWYDAFLASIEDSTAQYGIFYINSHDPYNTGRSGFYFSDKTIDDLFNDVTPVFASTVRLTYDLFICETKPVISSQPNYIWGEDGLIAHLNLWNVGDKILAVHEVPLFMIASLFYVTEGDEISREYINVSLPNVSSYHNKKLARYPFSYIRVETPAGDIKEYQFERFDLHNEGLETDGTAQFDINFDYNTQPELALVPMFYKQWKKTPSLSVGNYPFNFAERVAFQAIPQMPYTTDSFIAGLAASNADILMSRTTSEYYNMATRNQLLENNAEALKLQGIKDQHAVGGDIASAGLSLAAGAATGNIGSAVGGAQGVVNIGNNSKMRDNQLYNSMIQQSNAQTQQDIKERMMLAATGLSLETIEYNAVYDNFKDTKQAYVCDRYTPGSGTGLVYYNMHAVLDFIITRVKLRDAVLQKYDQYFSNYGYSSGRYGAPRIAAYLSNAATGKPHFAPSGSHNVTYVKTTNAAVKAPSKTSEQFWETMLDAGCQFIRGEDLIPTP